MTKRYDASGALVDLTKEEQALFDAQATPTPEDTSHRLNFLGFLALFTQDEQGKIVSSTDQRVKLFCLMAAGAQYVDLKDPTVVAGTGLLETLGLIGAGRGAQVLAGEAPSSK